MSRSLDKPTPEPTPYRVPRALPTGKLDSDWIDTDDILGGAGLAGVGSPEGVITANPGRTYIATNTGGFYVKLTGTGNTGWLLLWQ